MDKNEMNKVLIQSWLDYDPFIVRINEKKLLSLNFTEQEKASLAQNEIEALEGKSLKDSVRFLIGLNSINYQFWDLQDSKFIRYTNKGQTGALGSFAGFVELFDILEKNNFNVEKINKELMNQCFGNISDIERRINILKEALNTKNLDKVFEEIESHIKKYPINVDLAEKISLILPQSYADPYLKKIQLALYEISHVYNAHGIINESNITVAADYQLPKVLEGMGILEYSEELSRKIDNFDLIEEGSKEEKALRAATILSCNEISKQHNISIPALDRVLWLARNNFKKNFHLTRTSNY